MNKTYTLIFILIYSFSFSQNLTIEEIISLRKKNLGNVEEKLTSKGWDYILGEEPKFEKLGKATFAFKKSTYDDKAESFINYYYSNNSDNNRINIQIVKKEKYNLFLTRIKSLGFNLIESNISEGNIKKIYQSSKTTIIISIITQNNFSSTLYHFFIINTSDYYNNFNKNTEELEDCIGVDSIENFEPEVELKIKEEIIEGKKTLINEEFFIGTWSNENSVFTFSSLGDFTQKFDNGELIITKWKFVNEKLFIGNNNKLVQYNIIDNDTNYLSYNTNKNKKIFYAYRIGN